jgi:hypothetical protein
MSEFMEEEDGKANGDCKYRLVGVVVNSGETLNAGHCFSYVRERVYCPIELVDSNKSSCFYSWPTRYGPWLEYDDDKVRRRPYDDMLRTFFGGRVNSEDEKRMGCDRIPEGNAYWLTKNAFLLFYERVKLVDIYSSDERKVQVDERMENKIAPSYPLIYPSQCKHVLVQNITDSLINKRYHGYLKQDGITSDLRFNVFKDRLLRSELLQMFFSINKKLELKEYKEKKSDDFNLLNKKPLFLWINYLFGVFVHHKEPKTQLSKYLNDLSVIITNETPVLLYFVCNCLYDNFFTSFENDAILKEISFFVMKLMDFVDLKLRNHCQIILNLLVGFYMKKVALNEYRYIFYKKMESGAFLVKELLLIISEKMEKKEGEQAVSLLQALLGEEDPKRRLWLSKVIFTTLGENGKDALVKNFCFSFFQYI